MPALDTLQQELWQRIRAHRLDDPDAAFPFSAKLAREEGWTPHFTAKAIEEYRRFVLLCCIDPGGASPSETVDKVWHLHLLYTVDYWEVFCPRVLGQKLHHYPSAGGQQQQRHEDWRGATRLLYLQTFGSPPPPDIWPEDGQTSSRSSRRRPPTLRKLLHYLYMLPLLFLPGCAGNGWGGFFWVLVWMMLIGLINAVTKKKEDAKGRHRETAGTGSDGGGCGSNSSCGSDSSSGSSCSSGCGGCGGGGD